MTIFGVPVVTKYRTNSTQHIHTKKDLVNHYISTPGWFIQKKASRLHKHINLVNFFLQKKKKINFGCQHIAKKRSCFSLLSSSRSHCCTSLPLTFWSWIGLVISGGWRYSCGHIINRAWLCPMYCRLSIGAWLCTAYSWVVCITILGCLQAQAQ